MKTGTLDVVEAKELPREMQKAQGCLLLDVRTPGEFHGGHVKEAKLIPLGDLKPKEFLQKEGHGCPRLFVMCQTGARARKAIEQFQNIGFEGCVLVGGGMDAWVQAGLPVERRGNRGLPIARQVQVAVGSIVAIGSILTLSVDPLFAWIPLFMGSGLIFAGATGFCGLALILAKMPWNRLSTHGHPACNT